ncbi:hypothetical protein Tco_0485571 [Tanacetum coccineum]
MQRPPLFESDGFIYWNNFKTYVKSKDLDFWHIIINGDFSPVVKNATTQALEVLPFENQKDAHKKKLAKKNEARMVLYNASPKKEYERSFICKTAKEIWQSLLITHQVHEVIMEKDSEVCKGKNERVKSIALKAKKESIDDETSTSKSEDEEYVMVVRDFKKFFRRKDPNHLIGECLKPLWNKDQKVFVGGSWSDRKNEDEEKTNEETCLMDQLSNEVTLDSSYFNDNASS